MGLALESSPTSDNCRVRGAEEEREAAGLDGIEKLMWKKCLLLGKFTCMKSTHVTGWTGTFILLPTSLVEIKSFRGLEGGKPSGEVSSIVSALIFLGSGSSDRMDNLLLGVSLWQFPLSH
jgi:hypothetical protein